MKKGIPYQHLVADVMSALYPKEKFYVEKWVAGPDGRVNLDVYAMEANKKEKIKMWIECKDKEKYDPKDKIGKGVVSKLESEMRDLHVNKGIIFGNSEFTHGAIAKASRLKIDLMSALKINDHRVKYIRFREVQIKGLSIEKFFVKFYMSDDSLELFDKLDASNRVQEIYYEGLPIINWLSDKSNEALNKFSGKGLIALSYAFKTETNFTIDGNEILLLGLDLRLIIESKCLAQTVKEDVSLGVYDHVSEKIILPDNQMYVVGYFDNKNWREVSYKNNDNSDEPIKIKLGNGAELSLEIVLKEGIHKLDGVASPKIDDLIKESKRTNLDMNEETLKLLSS